MTFESSFPNARLYYTLDGSSPVFATPYSGPIAIDQSVVVRAVAFNHDFTAYAESDPVRVSVVPLYRLTAGTTGGGAVTVAPTGGLYLSNAVVRLTATASDGWTFLRWSGDASGIDPELDLTMTGEKSVAAVFGTALATSVVPAGFGTIHTTPDSVCHPYGSTVRLNGEPAAGRYFVQWSGAVGTGASSPVELTITNPNPAVSALFGTLPANHYALTVRVEGGPGNTVTRAPEQPYYASGTPVTLTAVPTPGELFWGWLGDVVSTQTQAMVTMTANRTVIAQFGAVPPVPANDAFANRLPLSGPEVLTTGRNAWATKEPGEPNHGGPGGKSLWWEWTSPASGPAVVSTLGSDFDTILGVYTGSTLNTLTMVGVDDDGNGNLTSKVTFNALAGTRYLIAVDGGGMPAAEGHVRLTAVVNTPPVVRLTAPITGTIFSLPGNVTLAADASDPGGAVARARVSGERGRARHRHDRALRLHLG